MRLFPALFVLCVLCGGGSAAFGQSLIPGGVATVVDIVDGDTVLLDREIEGSNEVRLVGLQAPKLPLGRPNFPKWPFADASRAALQALVQGRQVFLKFGGRRMDRYGRLLAHLYVDERTWVQGQMLQSGMARVYSFPDNRAMVAEMLELEKAARKAKAGIWGDPFYQVRTPENLDRFIGTFQVIEGVVFDAAAVRGATYVNFEEDWRSDFTLFIRKKVLALFDEAGINPLMLKGKRLRVRGWLKKRNGPMIEVTHPEQLEILSD